MEIEQRLRRLLAEELGMPESEIKNTDRLREDLGAEARKP